MALMAITPFSAVADSPPPLREAFIEAQQQQGFSKADTEAFLAKAQFNQAVLDAISRPWEAKPWDQYYPIFLTDKRLQAGLDFWREHDASIARAAHLYGVEPQIIVAIIGIETFYGQNMGKYPVLDALYTLGFHYPPRADFFRRELAALQTLVMEERLDLDQLKGSYAGAMGFGQFIPSSYRHFAVDFSQDGKRDLLGNADDAIGSVANYFHRHGWRAGEPVALKLRHKGKPKVAPWAGEPLSLTAADILSPSLALAKAQDLDVSRKAMLVRLEQASEDEFWLGLENFYVITRYNRSPLYAMAVYQFSERLKDARLKG
ncbi:lytic murein transglycosylase B [Shewanella sedimentimangrovi]|uniref:Lytic murein transglycosylase B n=1 Tax=Shewanella sedimentimangrovi TaxID=2814293 RepID=A0ABX7R7Q8_9GAMM|nr:lytic murein transglycosylase B [Shewanella sedimentimangrovi]QSX39120.1 lytic murein transglycosylase B [Shewanella sedimentimangrovi]